MKLEALEKAATAAQAQASRLGQDARQAEETACAAKEKSRKAKARLKLAKQESKELRQAAKEAKHLLADALLAAKKAAAEAASIEKKLRKLRKESGEGQAKTENHNDSAAHNRVAAKPDSSVATASKAKVGNDKR